MSWHFTNARNTSLVTQYEADKFPRVTVQLPIYNERFVVERLLDAAAMLDWPKDKLEIQVLDDSDDDTYEIVRNRVAHWSQKKVNIHSLRRHYRKGYKAGALARGLSKAKGDFIAIFDADFLPNRDFLKRTVPHFGNSKVGMVQAKWGFLNAKHSWLTKVQSLLLGPHFGIEHNVRFGRDLFFNFNGTAGIWRKEAIESAGGWQSDTVTEDLDLSYRAQLFGWKFVYLDDIVVPCELPVTLASFRSQQQRWAKGSMQTARKLLPRLLLYPSLPIEVKIEATVHLLANLGWVMGAVGTLTLYPVIISRVGIGPYQLLKVDLPIFCFATGATLLYFWVYAVSQKDRVSLKLFLLVPILTIGLAPGLALAVLEGCIVTGGDFKRTAKFGVDGRGRLPRFAFLYHEKAFFHVLVDSGLFLYCLLPVFFALERRTWPAIPFLLLFPLGFLLTAMKDVSELKSPSTH